MSDLTRETNHPAGDSNGIPARPASNRLQIAVIAIIGAALALLIAYQFFGCAACYGAPSI